VSAITVASMSSAALDEWGWRIPFFVGAALAASIGLARATMEESPEFERQQASGTVPRNPLKHTLTHQRAGIARGFAISALGSITYYVGITYVPAFLNSAGGIGEEASLWLSTIAAVMVILITAFIGAWSDRAGRRPVLVAVALAAAILPITMFSLMASGSLASALLGAVVLAGLAGR
jgi:MHS family proline/betaine transporter-like MFS transporter